MKIKLELIFFLGLCWLLSSCDREKAIAVSGHPKPAEEWIQGVGYIEPATEVRRLAFKHPGVISKCLVQVGQRVKKDDLLMCLSDAEERAAMTKAETMVALTKAELAQTLAGIHPSQISAQRAALEAAKAEAEYAKKNLKRQQTLATGNASTQSDRDLAEMQMQTKETLVRQHEAELDHFVNYLRLEDRAVMEAKVQQAEAQLAEAQATLAGMELRAPFDGTVLEILQREGNPAHTLFTEPVMVFADLSRLSVRAEIDETYALRLKEGQAAVVRTRDEGRREIPGRVRTVKNVMGKKTVFSKTATERKDLDVIQVLVDLPENTMLPVGLEVDVRIKTGANGNGVAVYPVPGVAPPGDSTK